MHRHLNLVVLVFVLLGGACGISPATGQPPQSAPEPAPDAAAQPPTVPPQTTPAPGDNEGEDQVVVPLSEPARRWIEQALRRQAADPTAPALSTGDPVLDDVLDVIRRQGSLLEGSALDPQLEVDTDELLQRPRERFDTVLPGSPYDSRVPPAPLPGGAIQAAPHPDARFHVAESLLRTARELAALGHRDNASHRLVAAMREQATMLLVDEYSDDLNRFED